eukprot:Skav235037  [mRNA]  locus=scaffold287:159594:164108:+ [translate_table: standard]
MAAIAGSVDIVLQKQLSPLTFSGSITIGGGAEVILHVPDSLALHVAKCTSVTLVKPVVRIVETVVHLQMDNSDGHLLLHPTTARGPYRMVELFGGLGGWSYASSHLDVRPVAIVDTDANVCHACARAHGTRVLSVDEFYQHALTTSDFQTVVVNGTVQSMTLWAAFGLLNVSVVCASPPCQPWSTSGRQSGLASFDGLLFPATLEKAAMAKVHAFLAENVVGFPNHSDYHDVIAAAAVKGLRLVDSGLVAAQRMLPVVRNRWLGVFIHVSIYIESEVIQFVKKYAIDVIPCNAPLTGPCLAEADAIHVNMSSVMARYGGQHLLPPDLLREKGLHTVLFGTLAQHRLFSPWEVLASLGFPDQVCVATSVMEAFLQTGNALSPIHAGFALAKAHVLLGDLSPFAMHGTLHDLLLTIAGCAIKLSKYYVVVEGDLCMLKSFGPCLPADAPAAKRQRLESVDATVPFHVEPHVNGTLKLDCDIQFEMPSNAGVCVPTSAANGGVLLLKHHHMHWAILVHGTNEEETTVDMPDLVPKRDGAIRFVAKHPLKKVVRSIVVGADADMGTVVRTMFPDMCEQVTWQVSCDGNAVGPLMPVAGIDAFSVDWTCFRPLAPTRFEKVMLPVPVDSPTCQVKYALKPKRWIKSPFSTRAAVIHVDDTLSIMQIAGAYAVHTQLALNMTCHMGSHVLDPDTTLSHVPMDQVISFKLAPLLGGGKQSNDQLKVRIRTLLESHGVAKDASQDRANAFLNRADHETLLKNIGGDDVSAWGAVKDEANRVHFRLVYRTEMTQAKKEGRSKPPNKHVEKTKAPPKSKDDFIANASNIRIDIDHFWDGDDHVPLLDPSRFGQDQCGLAIMSRADADRFDRCQPLSAEPLAVLMVGNNFAEDDQPFSMPAYTCQGQPIIIRAALRQYGDRPVTFRPAVPQMEVGRTAATVVELHIMKNEVVAWKECGVPLHYLGVHVSACRGNSLVSTWSLRTFSSDRKPTPFRDASYWHGFIKVEDAILDQVLARSGWAGIYLTPRNAEKRLDERYTAITIPDVSLADIQKKAASSDHALGIVRIKDQLAIRCRREHATTLRATLLPESAYVATRDFDQQDTMWLLKNIPCEIGCQGLSQALTQAQWNAVPVRAQGQNRWLVAAKAPPPAMHLCINKTYVLIEPVKRPVESNSVTMVAKQYKVDTVVTSNNGVTQVATSSRFQEIKTEMTEQMEQRLQDANQRIEHLQQALEQVRQTQAAQIAASNTTQQELAQVKEEQVFARQKIAEVESSIVDSGQTVIKTMQQMMQNMQSNLEQSMKQIVAQNDCNEEKDKRARTGDPPSKIDPFASRS